MKTKMKLTVVISILLVSIISINILTKKKVVHLKANHAIATVLTRTEMNQRIEVPYLNKSFIGFKGALGFKESKGNYNCVNTLGYLGKYQFGTATLKRFKIYNTQGFLKDAKLQENTFLALCSVNKWILRKDIKRKVGTKINGILITESGILAASHLAGAGNVKKYLRSNGLTNFKDAYGSNIEHYLEKFGGYDTSFIIANKKAKI